MADRVHIYKGEWKKMRREFFLNAAACFEHQKLLEECNTALDIWNQRRAEVCESPSSGKKKGDELLRLQAKYAKAYTVLQNHIHGCPQCQLVSRIGELRSKIERRDSENDSRVDSDVTLYS
jgi:hypothetical protein